MALKQTLAPGSREEAEVLYQLALLRRDSGRPEEAISFFERAVSAIEKQAERLGGGERRRADYNARFTPIYRDYMDLALSRDDAVRAFSILERSRARVLLRMLAERDLTFGDESARLGGCVAEERDGI